MKQWGQQLEFFFHKDGFWSVARLDIALTLLLGNHVEFPGFRSALYGTRINRWRIEENTLLSLWCKDGDAIVSCSAMIDDSLAEVLKHWEIHSAPSDPILQENNNVVES